MIKITLLSIFTISKLSLGITTQSIPAGHELGAFGQFCTNPVAGQVKCETTTDIAAPSITDPGFLNCGRPNDCCLCASIECGSATAPCDTLAFGKNAAFGVKAINVIGDNIEGASIDCIGTTSCADTHITAYGASELSCSGEYACFSAFVRIDSPVTGFGVECPVTGACEGLQLELFFPAPSGGAVCDPATSKDIILGGIECIVPESCLNLQLIVNNQGCDRVVIEAIQCPEGACTGAIFGFIGDVDVEYCELPATGLQPFGIEKCFNNLPELACAGNECKNQVRTLIDPLNNFELICEGPSACLMAQYTIVITTLASEPVNFLRILCTAKNACQNAKFVVSNLTQEPVSIAIECVGQGACDGTIFEGGVGTTFEPVLCENRLFCAGCTYNGVSCDVEANVPKPQIPNGPNVV